jgi:Asp-tRNA(Asn)/Glu-tRNA(Gln) amidotransferase A subunit family amidase
LRSAFLSDVVASMDRDRVDLIVYPTWTQPPPLLTEAREKYAGDNSQLIAPATGMPAATVPMGFVGPLPAGLQLLARPFGEGTLISAAYAYEQATHHRKPPVAADLTCKR